MGLQKLHRVYQALHYTWSKAHSKHSSRIKDTNKKSYNLILFIELNTQGFNSNPQHQTCRANHKENNKIGLAFFLFFYNFLGIFEVH